MLALTGRVRTYKKHSHYQNYSKPACYNILSALLEVVWWWKGADTTTRPWLQVALGHSKSFKDEGLPLGRKDLLFWHPRILAVSSNANAGVCIFGTVRAFILGTWDSSC